MGKPSVSFRFKQFGVSDGRCGMKVGTDGVLAGMLASMGRPSGRVCDVGAGCGIIALMIAQRFPDAEIDAVEIERGAFDDLTENILNSPWNNRIRPVEADFRSLHGKYDLIVSNPPYFLNGECAPDKSRAVARHAGALSPLALVGFSNTHLNDDGILAMIVPSETAPLVEEHAVFEGLALARRVDIRTSERKGVSRSFLEFSKDKTVVPEISELNLSGEDFRKLASPFYLNL